MNLNFDFNTYDSLFNNFKKSMAQLSRSKHSITGEITEPLLNNEQYALSGDDLAIKYSKDKSCLLPASHDAITLSYDLVKSSYRLNLIEFRYRNEKNLKPRKSIPDMINKFAGMKKILSHFHIWYENYLTFLIFECNPIPSNRQRINLLIYNIESQAKRKCPEINLQCQTMSLFNEKINEFLNYK
ncbi:hypothetical protein [Spiroplasma platyhelix]|uniref:Uncharacterized protein n=1 Tax=Spiroplasma platyhelix PALS-1 TaxID=1276218 RepID=A0A846TPK3_9MOLU|nr:hypothetical protein [Spiroplasma platyhelix]MBE4703827.1 hypothetical protein [Spiroplasma platyhelix PALS-1]NKE38200.1 hypothetical protein [Spiroplasma platyhelix PALS-1]UJB29085.1 hypothetical protein SPLAT_v1c03210 [Spiroplasma platyhelix PALS-1]